MAPQQPDRPDQPAQPYVRGDVGAESAGEQAAEEEAAGGPAADGPAQDVQESGDPAGAGTGEGEIRAAERQAQRAAAVAAAEGFHPLRVRPYVAEPGGEAAGTSVEPLVAFPAVYSGIEYPQEDPAEPGGPEDAAPDEAEVRSRHRRRRRGLAVTAAAVAASALAAGAMAVSGQMTGNGPGRTDRALPDQDASVPDVTLPSDASPATGGTASPVTRGAGGVTASPGASAASPATSPTGPSATVTGPAPSRQPPSSPATRPTGSLPPATPAPVLQLGDTGPAVTDLQQRLTSLSIFHGRADGNFTVKLATAVTTFQTSYNVHGDLPGVYGPRTREALEDQTSTP